MTRELLAKKHQILKIFSWQEYKELLSFVEEVYLAEFDLKILMARKFSNLYQALIDLVREENGGKVRQEYEEKFCEASHKTEPIVISDRALELYEGEIRSGRFKRILIVDDIIIHGRTIAHLYKRLMSILKDQETECDISVWAFAENKNGILEKGCLKERKVRKSCEINEWRRLSNDIVDMFFGLSTIYFICSVYKSVP